MRRNKRIIIKGMFVKNTPLFFVQKYCIKNKNKYNDIIDKTKRRHER